MDEIALFATIQPPPPRDAEAIRQDARDRLAAAMGSPPRPARHRRKPLVLAGAIAATGALAASGILLSAGDPVSGQAPRAVHVHLADWSVNTNPDGTITVKTRDLAYPRRLEHVLAEAGIPALVRWGELCRVPRSQYLPARGIVDGPDYVGGIAPPVWIHGQPEANDVWTFSPSRMPPGTRYMITAVQPNRVPASRGTWTWGLIRDNAHLTCYRPPVPPAGH